MRRASPLAFLLALALVAFGCGNDQGRGLTAIIANGSTEAITVRNEEPGHEADVATLEPGRGIDYAEAFAERGCHGPFVARTAAGVEIARAAELCPGSQWIIGASPRASG